MTTQADGQAACVSEEERAQQLARYLEQQPASVRASHRLMKILEAGSLVLPAAAVVAAIVVIARSAGLPGGAIPAALFAIPAASPPGCSGWACTPWSSGPLHRSTSC
jgi:hypothetical protein